MRENFTFANLIEKSYNLLKSNPKPPWSQRFSAKSSSRLRKNKIK
jgi:hypothetical protein